MSDDDPAISAALHGGTSPNGHRQQFSDDEWDDWPGPDDGDGGLSPDDLWDADPVLSQLRVYAQANRAGPWATLGTVLARVVAALPPAVQLPPLTGGKASLNLFVGLVGVPGMGKGVAERTGETFLGRGEEIWTAGIGSGEGLAHLYVKVVKGETVQAGVRRYLVRIPEIETMAALHARRGSTLLPELRKAWMGEELSFQYATREKRLRVPAHSYRLALIAGIQPTRASVLLDDADGGTPQRFIWLPVTDPDAPAVPPDAHPLAWMPPPPEQVTGGHDVAVMPVCETARQLVDGDRLARLRGGDPGRPAHSALARLKVAAAFAWLLRPDTAYLDGVTEDDWALAGAVMVVSDRTRQAVVDASIREAEKRTEARGKAEAKVARIVRGEAERDVIVRVSRWALRWLERQPAGEWVTQGEIRRAVYSRDRDYLDDALDALVKAGDVESRNTERNEKGQGGEGQVYRRQR